MPNSLWYKISLKLCGHRLLCNPNLVMYIQFVVIIQFCSAALSLIIPFFFCPSSSSLSCWISSIVLALIINHIIFGFWKSPLPIRNIQTCWRSQWIICPFPCLLYGKLKFSMMFNSIFSRFLLSVDIVLNYLYLHLK